jgi:hypothetical protein
MGEKDKVARGPEKMRMREDDDVEAHKKGRNEEQPEVGKVARQGLNEDADDDVEAHKTRDRMGPEKSA